MSVQCAARFAPPPPVESTAGLSASGRPHGSSARRGLGTGTVLLLAGGAAASAWAPPPPQTRRSRPRHLTSSARAPAICRSRAPAPRSARQ